MLVIVTVQKSEAGVSVAETRRATVTVSPRETRDDLFRHVMEHIVPESLRGGVVLFYSAEPLRLAAWEEV
jgi:hypothetical protein